MAPPPEVFVLGFQLELLIATVGVRIGVECASTARLSAAAGGAAHAATVFGALHALESFSQLFE